MTGRTIKIFLADGTPNGILTAEIINWTGIVLVAPRSRMADLAKRDTVRKTGVYCLVGPDPNVNLPASPNPRRVAIKAGSWQERSNNQNWQEPQRPH